MIQFTTCGLVLSVLGAALVLAGLIRFGQIEVGGDRAAAMWLGTGAVLLLRGVLKGRNRRRG
jgi:hypothetical protein